MKMVFSQVKKLIAENEGLRLNVYVCPAGKQTIGYGRNLEDTGITEEEANFLLENDIKRCEADVRDIFYRFQDYLGFDELDPVRQYVLIDMCYNLGKAGLAKFRNMLSALACGNYKKAAEEMLNSKWAREDVPLRAKKLSALMAGEEK